METLDLLLALAAIAASLVGFTGLLTAFQASRDSLLPNDISNIRILLIFSVSALVFSMLPTAVFIFGVGAGAWRALCGLLGLFLAIWLFQSPLWMRRHRIRPRKPHVYWPMLMLQAGLGLAVIAAALAGRSPAAFYVLGVLWCLLTAVVVFVVQIFVLLPMRDR